MTDRLAKRLWLLNHMDYVHSQAQYYRLHKRLHPGVFDIDPETVIELDEEEGYAELR
jgi:hypothetical protein